MMMNGRIVMIHVLIALIGQLDVEKAFDIPGSCNQ